MCGIAGVFGQLGSSTEDIINQMTSSLIHRGPDDGGVYFDHIIGLGHRRLSIIDLSTSGRQPMWSDDNRFAIIFNGEIYNYKKIRNNLRVVGYEFHSNTDTEVILKAFQEWGTDFLNRINGMFALAIYDRKEGSVFLARDRLGIKPLYFTRSKKGYWVFASEIRAILKSGLISSQLNRKALSAFLKYQTVHPPETLVEDVELMLPGTYAWITREGMKRGCYWNMMRDTDEGAELHTMDQVRTEIKKKLGEAVERRLISDVPIGAFLSGGIDSSLIVALMSKVSSGPVKTFTIAFDDPAFKDGEYARIVANQYKTDHQEVTLTHDDLLQRIPEALTALDHPSADGINTYIVSKAAKEAGLTVVLSGLGGDELFCGYGAFQRLMKQQKAYALWKYTPHLLRAGIGAMAVQLKTNVSSEKIRRMLVTDGSLEQVYPITRQFFTAEQINTLLSFDDYTSDPYESHLREVFEKNSERGVLTKVSFAEATTYMHNVLLRDTDQMSMAHALEIRVPFLDHELVSYVMAIRDELKRPNGNSKRLLIESCLDLLPEALIHRPKQGFVMPFDQWMKGPLKETCKNHLEVTANVPAFNEEAVWNNWHSFQKGEAKLSWSRLWLLVAFGSWYRQLFM